MRGLFGKYSSKFDNGLTPGDENKYIAAALAVLVVGGALYVLSFYW